MFVLPLAGQIGGDRNKPRGRGFDATDSRIVGRGRDRKGTLPGSSGTQFAGQPQRTKVDWNYDVAGPVNGSPAKFAFLFDTETAPVNPTADRVYVAVNAVAGGTTPRLKTFILHSEQTEISATTPRALEAINDLAEVALSTAVPAGSTGTRISSNTWVSSRGNPGTVKPGPVIIATNAVWTFTFSALSTAVNSNQVFIRAYKRSSTGTLTQLMQSSASAFLSKTKNSFTVTGTVPATLGLADRTFGAEDRLAFQVFATNVATGTRTVTFFLEGVNTTAVTTTIPASNVYAFSDIYSTAGFPDQQPFCLWQTAIGNGTGRIDGSSVALNSDGSRIFLGCTDGKVYCLNTTDGSVVWTYDTQSSIVNSTPFFDVGTASLSFETFDDLVWIGSTDGRLHKITADETKVVNKIPPGVKTSGPVSSLGAFPIHSTPIHYNNLAGIDVVLVATDDGHVYRLNPGTFLPDFDSGFNSDYDLTDLGFPVAADAIWGTPIFDGSTDTMVLAVNGSIYKVNLRTGVVVRDLLFASGSIMYSSPAIDFDNNFAYVGGGTKLWKEDFIGWVSTFQGITAGINPDNTFPRSSPLWIPTVPATNPPTGLICIADGGGNMNRFTANNVFGNPTRSGQLSLPPSTTDSDSPVIMDFFTGNIYFGATNFRVYQLSQVF